MERRLATILAADAVVHAYYTDIWKGEFRGNAALLTKQ